MPVTPTYGLRYRAATDPPAIHTATQELALDVEDELVRVDANGTTANTAITALNQATDLVQGSTGTFTARTAVTGRLLLASIPIADPGYEYYLRCWARFEMRAAAGTRPGYDFAIDTVGFETLAAMNEGSASWSAGAGFFIERSPSVITPVTYTGAHTLGVYGLVIYGGGTWWTTASFCKLHYQLMRVT